MRGKGGGQSGSLSYPLLNMASCQIYPNVFLCCLLGLDLAPVSAQEDLFTGEEVEVVPR